MRTTLRFNILTGVMLSLMLPGFVSPASANPSWANTIALNFLSEIKGDVKLKRSQWKEIGRAHV